MTVDCSVVEGPEEGIEWDTSFENGVQFTEIPFTNEAIHVLCDFRNREGDGFLAITKSIEDGDDLEDPQPFTFTTNVPGCAVMGPLADYLGDDAIYGDREDCHGIDWATIGDVTILEQPVAGWVLIDVVCSGGSGGGLDQNGYDVLVEDGRITGATILAGQVDTTLTAGAGCTFVNAPAEEDEEEEEEEEEEQPAGSITIVKSATPSNGFFSFDFASPQLGGFALNHNQSRTFSDLDAGSYAVTELTKSGWDFVSLTCDSTAVTKNGATVTVRLAEGQDVTCVYENRAVVFNEEPPVVQAATHTPTPPPTATPTPTKTPTAVTGSISPPNTGDGGLSSVSAAPVVLSLAVLSVIAAIGLRLGMRPSR